MTIARHVATFLFQCGLCAAPFVGWYLLLTSPYLLVGTVLLGILIWLVCFDD